MDARPAQAQDEKIARDLWGAPDWCCSQLPVLSKCACVLPPVSSSPGRRKHVWSCAFQQINIHQLPKNRLGGARSLRLGGGWMGGRRGISWHLRLPSQLCKTDSDFPGI